MRTSDGRVRWLWEKTSIVRDAAGEPVSVNGVMFDVTELKRTQEALLVEAEHRVAERARFEATLRRQADEHHHHARHDELTGLPNRRHLYEHLAAHMEHAGAQEGFSLLLVDLDRFKEVNDVLGHHSGDELLCSSSRTASGASSARTTCSHGSAATSSPSWSPARRGPEAGLEVARRLTDSLAREFVLSGVPIHVESSIGIARYPQDGLDAIGLLRCADAAMYAAKYAEHRARAVRRRARPPLADAAAAPRRAAPRAHARRARPALPAEARARAPARSSASRRSCAGAIRSTGCWRRSSSCRSPSRPG